MKPNMKKVNLTKQDVNTILNSVFTKNGLLNPEEVNAIAQKLNVKINLPLLSDKKELYVFVKLIKWIDSVLYDVLPNEYYEMIKESSNGFSESEIENIVKRIVPVVNSRINILFLDENLEAEIISFVVETIAKAMVKGVKLEEKELSEK